MDMRDYDPAIARWTGIDPVTHFDQSPYMAMNGNPVFYADPSGADGTPVGITPEAINTWHFAGGNQMFTGAGNLSSGDHMFGASGDEFWNNEIAYTGGELAWSNYFADNRKKASIEVGTLSVGEFLDQEDPTTKKSGVEEQNRMNLEICKFWLDAALVVDGAAELSAVKWGATKLLVKGLFSSESKIIVKFGEGENQVYHAFRHIEKMGLNANAVKRAILKDIPRISKNVTYGGKTIYTQIEVEDHKIIYSAHRLENGTINVGRINGL